MCILFFLQSSLRYRGFSSLRYQLNTWSNDGPLDCGRCAYVAVVLQFAGLAMTAAVTFGRLWLPVEALPCVRSFCLHEIKVPERA